jgi:hypothetical protein
MTDIVTADRRMRELIQLARTVAPSRRPSPCSASGVPAATRSSASVSLRPHQSTPPPRASWVYGIFSSGRRALGAGGAARR